jgi:hypothetical protein
MCNVCNKIREKTKVTDLKPFIYADDIMWGDIMKELDISPLGKRKQELQLADKLGEDSNVKAVEEEKKIMKISGSEIKKLTDLPTWAVW